MADFSGFSGDDAAHYNDPAARLMGASPGPGRPVNDEIHFGEVEHAAPSRALRPDQNRHFTVAPYGDPRPGELAIYIDLDVLADLEAHARSDTSVELGGVLLGGTFEDDSGQPFVVISDSLRAQHFESTKGSFKFTHETWTAITRERESFPADLQMVGWYHTHPGWGVFLSGMDSFICENFFNKRLDLAYVIDPCQGDRGMFQWTSDNRQLTQRTGGFFVTATRFRAHELSEYVAELQSAMPGPTTSRTLGGSALPSVVHLQQPSDQQPPWLHSAVLGLLAVQCLIVALLAWRLLTPLPVPSAADDKTAAAIEKLSTALGAVDARHRAELAEGRLQGRLELLDAAFRELKGSEAGSISRLDAEFNKSLRLAEDVEARDAQIRELRGLVQDARTRLQSLEATASREEKRLQTQIDELTTENGRLHADLKKHKLETAAAKLATRDQIAGSSADASQPSTWWWLAGGVVALTAVVGSVWWLGSRSQPQSSTETSDEHPIPK